jgi:hypothetical protein
MKTLTKKEAFFEAFADCSFRDQHEIWQWFEPHLSTPEPPAAGPTIQGDAAEMIDKAKVLISQMLGAATLIQRIRDIAECESDLEDIKQEQVKVHKAKNELLFLIKQLYENQSKGDEVKSIKCDHCSRDTHPDNIMNLCDHCAESLP